ncbi:hypothetical protein EUX98_g6897 [Antrodiella citrinella]|uniref:C2H2-type domain-containing protein n=1 Tax=Antrodiella citrinella TaxID=2447956 RepID=A0A4S4MN14_9APHY|nr:hypothetical protein EUX98_g6897 [Antrodiella citrinella]
MKRSFNYSFTATLAARTPPLLYSGQYLKSPLLQTSYLAPTDFSLRQPLAQPWYHSPIKVAYRQPLTGLGISISPSFSDVGGHGSLSYPQPVALPLRLPTVSSFSSGTRYGPSLRQLELENTAFCTSETSRILRTYDSPMLDLSLNPAILVTDDPMDAYSSCPNDDFMAHSPSQDIEWPPTMSTFLDVNMTDEFASSSSGRPFVLFDKPRVAPTEPLIGLFADFNMREYALSQRPPSLCINPALLMGNHDSNVGNDQIQEMDVDPPHSPAGPSPPPCDSIQYPPSADPDAPTMVNFTDADVDAIVYVLSGSAVKKEPIKSPTLSQALVRSNKSTPILQPYTNDQGLPVPPLPTRSGTISFPPSPNLADMLPMKPLSTPKSPLLIEAVPAPRAPLGDITALVAANRNSVFSAHLGIDLEELRAKAAEFRLQNPGQDIDKAWLATYAGKLSETGERLDEFRCYVKNCKQMNRRRDHILVHVGSHVEFRPFQCDFCEMKFLRKNECKRHMSSHGGLKPYTCEICAPYQEKSFVRQDLLKRHIKVTHAGGALEYGRRRKRIKLEKEIEQGNMLTFASPLLLEGPKPAHG